MLSLIILVAWILVIVSWFRFWGRRKRRSNCWVCILLYLYWPHIIISFNLSLFSDTATIRNDGAWWYYDDSVVSKKDERHLNVSQKAASLIQHQGHKWLISSLFDFLIHRRIRHTFYGSEGEWDDGRRVILSSILSHLLFARSFYCSWLHREVFISYRFRLIHVDSRSFPLVSLRIFTSALILLALFCPHQ